YRELAPEGSFDLDLTTLQVSRDRDADTGGGGAEGEILVEFAGRMNLGPGGGKRTVPPAGSARRPCRLKVSGSPMELSGVLETKGSYHTKRGFDGGRARLAAERLVVRGKTITDMNLEAIYDPNTRTWTAADFVGRCYGGKLLGNLQVGPSLALRPSSRTSDAGPEYVLQVAFNDVDLQQFLLAGRQPAGAEKGGGRELPPAASSGTMDAWLSLNARMGEGFAGEGTPLPGAAAPRPQGIVYVDIANMQVGKVSPLGTVLSVLRLNEPTDYTFERMLIDACIRGDKLLIPKLDLSGRNTAFAGAGTMDLPSEEMSLTLTARSRHAAAGPSVLQSLTEGLGGAVVRIEVTGTAGSPRVQTKALPVLEDSLRLLGTPQEGKKGKK
ncbi:MAG: hypothetical protein FJ280_07585, partial [Planctomycetes bacterium]|nr:hypothetical protein [Planctomycetota bacterium]